jgi:hypothetical protein
LDCTATKKLIQMQRALHLRRFSMALGTYSIVILGSLLTQWLGLAHMSFFQWVIVIGLFVIGNGAFFLIFLTGANLRFSDPSLIAGHMMYCILLSGVLIFSMGQIRPLLLLFYIPALSLGLLGLTSKQYWTMAATVLAVYGSVLILQYMQTPGAFDAKYELFVFFVTGLVLTWFALFSTFISDLLQKRHQQNTATFKAGQQIQLQNGDLSQAMNKTKTLGGLLPICASCKNIRDDQGNWNQLECYIASRSEAKFSHSICPDCARELYSDVPGFKAMKSRR